MTVFAKVNRRRLWELFAVIWVAVIATYYWDRACSPQVNPGLGTERRAIAS